MFGVATPMLTKKHILHIFHYYNGKY